VKELAAIEKYMENDPYFKDYQFNNKFARINNGNGSE